MSEIFGRIHSFQSLGTVDGPGVRAVVFMQGCPLRCVCCHNPDTWDFGGGTLMSVDEICEKILRCRNYFGKNGGVTFSGGEPLCQSEFLLEVLKAMKKEGIHCALDTSGCILDDNTKELLKYVDLVLLDYKYTNDEDYQKYTGLEKSKVDEFLEYTNKHNIPVWIRQVIIPKLSDSEESAKILFDLQKKYDNIQKTELLPFRKLCLEKYKNMGIPFALQETPEASVGLIEKLYKIKDGN